MPINRLAKVALAAILILVMCGRVIGQEAAAADAAIDAIEDGASQVADHFPTGTADFGGEGALARTMEEDATKFGTQETVQATEKVGPEALTEVADMDPAEGQKALQLMARDGDSALYITRSGRRMAIFMDLGNDAVTAMEKQKGIVEGLLETFGRPAAQDIDELSDVNGKRLINMADSGALNANGQAPGMLSVIGKYGDTAMNFIWKHKGTLAVGAVAVAFLRDPKPFIDGTRKLTTAVIRTPFNAMSKPLATVAKTTNWTVLFAEFVAAAAALTAFSIYLRHRRTSRLQRGPASAPPAPPPHAQAEALGSAMSPSASANRTQPGVSK